MRAALRPSYSSSDAALLNEAAAYPDLNLADLTVERLAALAKSTDLDFATAVFFDRAHRRAINAGFDDSLLERAEQIQANRPDIIAVVPGAFHGNYKHTGADGLKIVETVAGLAPIVEVIPVLSFGRLEENAQIILDWLEKRRGQRVLLTSLSKGGADVKWALRSPRAAEAFKHVSAWVSFSGIVQGTPLINWLGAHRLRSVAFRLLLNLQGHQSRALDELGYGDDSLLATWPQLPEHMRIIHVCGCPLRSHLTHKWAPRGYERLAPLGPNDGGGNLLGELSTVPGSVYPIWGADHYLQPSWSVTPRLRGIVATAAALDAPFHPTQSASAPIPAPATKSRE